jgi:SWI2/SNF2 ATPase/Domain of unknown function (DUF4276)
VIEVVVVAEGQTEETFVRDVLAPELAPGMIFLSAGLVGTSPTQGGGALSYPRVQRYLRNTLRERSDTYVTTFFDLYRLDRGFPGADEAAVLRDPPAKAGLIETRFREAVIEAASCREERFLAHIQPYEFVAYNAALVVSDGLDARIGPLAGVRERFMPWRTIGGEDLAPTFLPAVEVLLQGVFDKRRFLDLLHHFIVFEDLGGGALAKKMAGYHQFHAVNVAVEETLRAVPGRGVTKEDLGRWEAGRRPGGDPGDRRVGVVWHTQGSGKSLTMAFYAGRLILHPEMANPTIVVLTDRNDLDDQLFGTFARCRDLLRQAPVQAESRADLRRKLHVAGGGVVFTTIQKFFPRRRGTAIRCCQTGATSW